MKLIGRKKQLDKLWKIIREDEVVWDKVKKWLKDNCDWNENYNQPKGE